MQGREREAEAVVRIGDIGLRTHDGGKFTRGLVGPVGDKEDVREREADGRIARLALHDGLQMGQRLGRPSHAPQ